MAPCLVLPGIKKKAGQEPPNMVIYRTLQVSVLLHFMTLNGLYNDFTEAPVYHHMLRLRWQQLLLNANCLTEKPPRFGSYLYGYGVLV